MAAESSERLQQEIEFDSSQPLGMSVDDGLKVQRINDPESPAVLKAQYCLIQWKVVAVDGETVASKSALVAALQRARTKQGVKLRFETERAVKPQPDENLAKLNEQQTQAASKRALAAAPSMPAKRVKEELLVELPQSEEAREILQLGSKLPTFELAGENVTRLITGSCTWQLAPGDTARTDVAVRGCAAYTAEGCRTFDCGDIYAGVEGLVGRFVATARGHSTELAKMVRLHTKVIPDVTDPSTLRRRITASVLRSANRLGVPTLNLVNLHWWDWGVEGLDVALDTLESLQRKGIVQSIGMTNIDTEHFEKYGDRLVSVQINLSLVDRRPLTSGLVQAVTSRGKTVLAHGCLCGGLIADEWLDKQAPELDQLRPGVTLNRVLIDEFGGWDAFQQLLQTLATVGRRHEATISQVAVAWVLAQPGVSAVVLGARDPSHVERAAAATDLQLVQDDFDDIAACVNGRGPKGPIYGLERTPDHRLAQFSGAGSDGTTSTPVNRNSSGAASSTHLDECAERLRDFHEVYECAMPPIPDDVASTAPRAVEVAKPWMAKSAYQHLVTEEIVLVLRNVVAEIDCLPDDYAQTKPLRTFAANMLASAEQALFVETREKKQSSPRASRPSHENTKSKAASAAQSAFRNRILDTCLRNTNPALTPGGDDKAGCRLQ